MSQTDNNNSSSSTTIRRRSVRLQSLASLPINSQPRRQHSHNSSCSSCDLGTGSPEPADKRKRKYTDGTRSTKARMTTSTPNAAPAGSTRAAADKNMQIIHEEEMKEKVVRIRYVQRRDDRLGCTLREVNIIFTDDEDEDDANASAEGADGNRAGKVGGGKRMRKKTTIRITREPSDKENSKPHN